MQRVMALEDVEKRLKSRNASRSSQLAELWHGEATSAPAPEVTPANRTAALVKAWLLLLLGIGVTGASAIVALTWFNTIGRWQTRGLVVIACIGVAMVVKSTQLFDAAGTIEPLPRASLKR
jgi:hypothetical protein